jgi:hypothetical protein
MKRADYVEKRREILRDCEEKLSALDKVFAMFGGTPIGVKGNEAVAAAIGWTFDVSKREAVRLAIQQTANETFGAKDVRAALDKEYADYSKGITDNQLSAILSTFAAKKQIGLHRKKSGNLSAIYERKVAP